MITASVGAFQHGPLRVEPGASARGVLGRVKLLTGDAIELPYVVVHGARSGPTFVVTAASHGNEIVGTGAAIAFLRSLDPAALRGTVIVIPVVNPPAVAAASYTSPSDGVNMSGPLYWNASSGSSTSHQLGTFIGEILTRADFYIDLHGNREPCWPMTMMFLEQARDQATRDATIALSRAFGLTSVDMSDPPAHPASFGPMDSFPVPTALANGIPAIMVELVGAGSLGDAERGCRGLLSVLRSLDMLEDDRSEVSDPTRLSGCFRYWGALETDTAGLMWIKHPVGVPFKKGTLLLEITDVCGEVLRQIHSPADGFCWAYGGTQYGSATHAVPAGTVVALMARSGSGDDPV